MKEDIYQRKVLIVEDEHIISTVLANRLADAGFTHVKVMNDGVSAWQEIIQDPPDVVILDLVLPNKTGAEVLADMHRDERLQAIPVIALTNSMEDPAISATHQFGAVDYVVKADFSVQKMIVKLSLLLAA